MISQTQGSFWKGRRVFVTSPRSFLGSWLCFALLEQQAQVFGFGEEAEEENSLFDLSNLSQKISMTYGDLRDQESLRSALQFAEADVLLHLGEFGSLNDRTKSVDVFSRSVVGTANLFEVLKETASIRSVVVLSSDKVYGRDNQKTLYTEESAISAGALLPTAKLCAELVALSYRETVFSPQKYNKHKIAIATARLESAIGGGDFAAGSLMFELVSSFLAKKAPEIKNPQSVRPWIFVLDQVQGVLNLAEMLVEKGPKLAPTYNLGAQEYESVGSVVDLAAKIWGFEGTLMLPESTSSSYHGRLNSELSLKDLSWRPTTGLKDALKLTVEWYKKFYKI